MNEDLFKRNKKIKEIISITKLSIFFFCSVVIFNNTGLTRYFDEDKDMVFSGGYALFLIMIVTFILFTWHVIYNTNINKDSTKLIESLETILFIIIFCVIIYYTGAYKSQNKVLFIFLIITHTIQYGKQRGIKIAVICSLIILTIDLLYFKGLKFNAYFENDLILSAVFVLTALPLGFYVEMENEHRENLCKLANFDGLTGVYNHRYFHETLKDEIELANKMNWPLSLIFIDIDYFKQYNDLYGHQTGDEVLKKIGEILRNCRREKDTTARYGGEEFVILLPNTSERDALKMAEKVRLNIEKCNFIGEEDLPNGKLTVSMGVSIYPIKAKSDLELIKSADDALYRAKFFNKNRVESYYSILEEIKEDIEAEHVELITTVKTLISVINAKDRYTYGHSERVVMYCKSLAEELNLAEEDKKRLKYAAYMHDIGKINISKEILNKKMPLTKDEWETLKSHPQNGVDIIKPVNSLAPVMPIILHHHERYDGTGYPMGLSGEEIPYLARVITVVDSFDAMTSNRPYNVKKTYEEGIKELIRCKWTQFDGYIVDAFVRVIQRNKNNLDSLK